jgi:hypothetical protein
MTFTLEYTMRIAISIDKLRVTTGDTIVFGLNNLKYEAEYQADDVGKIITGIIDALKAAKDSGLEL